MTTIDAYLASDAAAPILAADARGDYRAAPSGPGTEALTIALDAPELRALRVVAAATGREPHEVIRVVLAHASAWLDASPLAALAAPSRRSETPAGAPAASATTEATR